jgi:regulator of RNase E activity RraA
MDRLGLSGVVTGIPQRSGKGRIAGRAVTVKLGTGAPPPGPPKHLGVAAIEAGNADSIIVIEQTTGIDAGCWGGLLTMAAKTKGIAGVVADGHVRDIDEAQAYGFAIFSRHVTARTARGRVVEKATNVPVRIGDIEVQPGDYAIADGSAVAFIAEGRIDEVLTAAEAIAQREADMAAALREGADPAQVLGGNYEHMLKR